MRVTLQTLHDLIASAVDAGVQAYIKSTEPDQDRIKRAEARRYIAKLGYQPVMIDKWRARGLLTPIKIGEAQNAAVWYSLAEIKSAIATNKLNLAYNEEY